MNEQRRRLLNVGAAAVLASIAADAEAQPIPASSPAVPPGKPGDFDFLTGEWRIEHRRLKSPGTWDEFKGEATCFSILGGVAHIEELRIPARDFSGMGLRLLDRETKVWSDYWVNAKSGVLGAAGQTGGFVNGVGTFSADEVDGDTPIKVRGVWDRITGSSHRWRQGVSRDGGKTWEDNWFMDWTKA